MEGLGEPVSVRNETDKYFYDNNELQQFIDENFSFTMNEKDKIKFKDFYDEFVEFSGTKVSKSKFANILRDEFNFEIKSGKGNQREIFKIIRKVEVTDNNRIVTEVESWDDLHPAENLF